MNGCPYCGSVDLHRSHRAWCLDRVGLHRLRCGACGGAFWRSGRQAGAFRSLRRAYFEAPALLDPRPGPADRIDLGPLDRALGAPGHVPPSE